MEEKLAKIILKWLHKYEILKIKYCETTTSCKTTTETEYHISISFLGKEIQKIKINWSNFEKINRADNIF